MSSVLKLMESYEDCNLIMEVIDNTLHSIHDYISVINRQENVMTNASLNKDNVIDLIKVLNSDRHILLDDMVLGILAINRLCVEEGLEKIYDGDEHNKSSLVHFAMEFNTNMITYKNEAM